MDNSAIEQMGVSAVTSYLCTGGYVSPQIDKNDKTPLWDGFLNVYESPDQFNNKNFSYRVPVQVKASESRDKQFPIKTSYSVPIVNLENYLNDGGVVFFKVIVCGGKNEIYVCFLTKEKIERILADNGRQKSVTLDLEKVPKTVDVLLVNLRRIYLQRKHPLIDLSVLKNSKKCKITVPVKRPPAEMDPLAYLTSRPVDMLLSVDDFPGQFFVKDGPVQLKITGTSYAEISIEGKTYYHEYGKEYDDTGIKVYVGKCCVICISDQEDEKSVKFNFTFKSSTIEENISELNFLLAVKEHKYICFDTFRVDLDKFEMNDEVLKVWENAYRFWCDVQKLFQILHLPLDVDFKNVSIQEERDLNALIKALLYNQPINARLKETSFLDFRIRNMMIIVAALKVDDEFVRLYDVDSLEASYIDENNKQCQLPVYSAIFEMNKLPDNIDFSNIVDKYKEIEKKNKEVVLRAGVDLLNMLNHYDKKTNEKLLNAAFELSKWLKNKKSNHTLNPIALKLDYLQTIKRMGREFSPYEKRLLNGIDPEDHFERFACCVLKDDMDGATKYFRQLSIKQKEKLKKMPIYHFMNQK